MQVRTSYLILYPPIFESLNCFNPFVKRKPPFTVFGPINGAQLTPAETLFPSASGARGIPNVHSGETIVISLDKPGGTQVPTLAPRALARLF